MPRGTRRRLAHSVAALLAAAPAFAGAVTCTVGATSLAFGVYDPQRASATDSSASVTVQCQPVPIAVLQTYTLSLSSGAAGNYAQRMLSAGGGATLQYQLYRDVTRTQVWGDGSAGTSTVVGAFLLQVVTSVSAVHTLYGRLTPRQTSATAGSYADTVVLTISY